MICFLFGISSYKVEIDNENTSLYPNPTSKDFTGLKCNLRNNGIVNIKLFDTSGRLVKTIIKETQSMGSHYVKIDLGGLTNGVYFVELICDNNRVTKKLIKTH